MSLANKYRPKSLDEIIGNKLTVESLKSLMSSDDIPHMFLFSGPKGTGKTTLANIVSNMLGADSSSIFEINTSNETGVDAARKIIAGLQYAPLIGEKKIYILEECHNTSKQFQDSLLRDTENPPSHIYFILCTTEPNKLNKAFFDRCTDYTTKTLNKTDMFNMLGMICKNENIPKSENILTAIYEESEGGPRRAIKILEKVKGLSGKNFDLKEIIEFIKTSEIDGSKETIDLIKALVKKKSWSNVSEILKKLNDNPETVRHAVMNYSSKVLLSGNNHAYHIIECMKNNFYDSGKAGLVAACYRCVNEKM